MTPYDSDNIVTLGPGLIRLKKITGLFQMSFGVTMLLVYYFIWPETIIQLGGAGVFTVGFFTYGIQFQNVIIRSRKEMLTTRGLFFVTINNRYTVGDFDCIVLSVSDNDSEYSFSDIDKRVRRYSNSYRLSIKLRNGNSFQFSSSENLSEMKNLGARIQAIIGCNLVMPEVENGKLPEEIVNLPRLTRLLQKFL